MAESESERERLKYAVVKSSALSNRKARSLLGIDDMTHRKQKVHQEMEEASAIREAIESIAKVKENVVLQSFGVHCDESESDESEASESETDTIMKCLLLEKQKVSHFRVKRVTNLKLAFLVNFSRRML